MQLRVLVVYVEVIRCHLSSIELKVPRSRQVGSDARTPGVETTGVLQVLGTGMRRASCLRPVGLLRNESPDPFLPEAAMAAAQTCTQFGAFGRGVPIASEIRDTTTC